MFIAGLISLQFLLIALILLINTIKPYIIPYISEENITWINERKIQSILAIFFIGNMVSSSITNTGAFEMYIENEKIYSAVENNGSLPNLNFIGQILIKKGVKIVKNMAKNKGN